MATWTTPRDWSTDEVVTAAMLDTHVKDNLTFIHSPPHVETYRTSNVAIAANASYTISWTNENVDDDDNGAMFEGGALTRHTIRTAGLYLVYCRVIMTISGDSTFVWLRPYIEGALVTGVGGNKSAYNASIASPVSVAQPMALTAGQYIEWQVLSEGGTGSPLDYLDEALGGAVWLRS